MSNEIHKAFHYYLAFQEEINAGHMGEFVGIAQNKVQGYWKDFESAFNAMQKKGFKQGAFNVTRCHPVGEPEVFMGFVPVTGPAITL
jgi:hypothetical protein